MLEAVVVLAVLLLLLGAVLWAGSGKTLHEAQGSGIIETIPGALEILPPPAEEFTVLSYSMAYGLGACLCPAGVCHRYYCGQRSGRRAAPRGRFCESSHVRYRSITVHCCGPGMGLYGTRHHLGVPLSPLAVVGTAAPRRTAAGWSGRHESGSIGAEYAPAPRTAPHPAPALPVVFPISHRANGRYAVRRQNRTLAQRPPGTPRYGHATATSAGTGRHCAPCRNAELRPYGRFAQRRF